MGQRLLTLKTVVHPWHCDQMGHWSVRWYGAAFDDAGYQFLGRIAGIDQALGLGWADVRTEIDYRAECRVGTMLDIHSQLERVGRSSLTYRHVMSDSLSGQMKAQTLTTTVRFDLKARRATPLEPEARQRAEALLEDLAADGANWFAVGTGDGPGPGGAASGQEG